METKRVIYVSSLLGEGASGGALVSERNLRLLTRIVGPSAVTLYSFRPVKVAQGVQLVVDSFLEKRRLLRVILYIFGFMRQSWPGTVFRLVRLARKSPGTTVCFDSTLYGVLVLALRMFAPSARILVVGQNVELTFCVDRVRAGAFGTVPLLPAVWLNEWLSQKLAHRIFYITETDRDTSRRIYGKARDPVVIPVTLDMERYRASTALAAKSDFGFGESGYVLFVGSGFFANTHGLGWFITNVMPQVDIGLVAIGRGLSAVSAIVPDGLRSRIKILDYVEDLSPYYGAARCVIAPIFLGGGMKVKVAEALMYGKFIVATSQAMIGYRSSSINGAFADQADGWIAALATHVLPPPNSYIKGNADCFAAFYDDSVAETSLRLALSCAEPSNV